MELKKGTSQLIVGSAAIGTQILKDSPARILKQRAMRCTMVIVATRRKVTTRQGFTASKEGHTPEESLPMHSVCCGIHMLFYNTYVITVAHLKEDARRDKRTPHEDHE